MVCKAKTGTGKTLAFLIPALEQVCFPSLNVSLNLGQITAEQPRALLQGQHGVVLCVQRLPKQYTVIVCNSSTSVNVVTMNKCCLPL